MSNLNVNWLIAFPSEYFWAQRKLFLIPTRYGNLENAWPKVAKKGTKSYFGYKLYGAMDEDYGLIRRIEVTAANVHDGQADLAKEGEVRYADKGYFGAKTGAYDAAMRKATRGTSSKL